MSSYNENLNASVVTSLQAQELKLSTTQSELNAGMFTLYYAEDAKITAQEKLQKTENKYKAQEIIKDEAVSNNNLATNVLASANQEKQSNLQSVSNSAVSAANVQIATNAIVNLASDMGSIVSILNAADYGSQIYEQAIAVNQLMNDTAYNAEVTSQWAMEASSLTAEVTASTVADMAASTSTSLTNLLGVLNSQLGATATLEITENTNYSNAATEEKKAEGKLIDAKVEYDAAKATYLSSINELNLNLQVTDTTPNSFTVEFNPYLNPFHKLSLNIPNSPYSSNPVENYYIFVVKESNKSTFSLATAEGLMDTSDIAFKIKAKQLTTATISKKISLGNIKDSNNENLVLGENYVVFVLAQFTIEYKKSLNNFDDYLTAASSKFVLTTPLNSPNANDITVDFLPADNNPNHITSQVLQFNVNEKVENVEYRCLFLLNNTQLVNHMLKPENLLSIENQIVKEINTEINKRKDEEDRINAYNNQNLLQTLQNELDALETLKAQASKNSTTIEADADADNDTTQTKDSDSNLTIDTQISELKTRIQSLTSIDLRDINPSGSASQSTGPNETPKPGFFFNQLIAENISNYSVPVGPQINKSNGKVEVTLPILENTTDNFGNPLIDNKQYIPVVLAVASGPKKFTDQFSNAISDFKNTAVFTYKTTAN
ncbi:conserved hypothetical protein [Flavobacterium sp. 9AF]|uniref:hypothetical protein n=1 Tax=Flavobacterium sp. 9AF TaxID=2653142 RepID=UPI0012EF93BC|nr:hypothetical protein [Flavobacterium sp. 9AF]VXB08712.1 conserved hypothetical protein [Flavobacterium sp. 9AF]